MAEAQRGTKRKRYEHKEEDIGVKIAGKLHHDLKEIRKAAKKAKTFETQKLVKKLKSLRGKSNDVKEIPECEAQLEALKHTDHEPIANTALTTKVKKDRLLSENASIQAAIAAQLSTNLLVPAAAGTPSSKVQSRLLSSKILATEVAAAVEDLKSALQIASKDSPQGGEVDGKDNFVGGLSKRPKKAKKVESIQVKRGEDLGNIDEGEDGLGANDEAGWESGSVGGDEEATEDDWESGSVRSKPNVAGGEQSSSLSDSDSDQELGEEKPAPGPGRKEPAVPKAKSKPSAAESTFLPSLSVGFIRGDSDSEWSDGQAKTADSRKNRRGQRARRAIWEKKYGKNANHSKKQREEMAASDRGRNRHPGLPGHRNSPRDPSGPGRRGKPEAAPQLYHQEVDAGWGQRSNSHPSTKVAAAFSRPVTQQPRHREEHPLHPSWEAKKKQKEKQGAGILPPQGTKIKF